MQHEFCSIPVTALACHDDYLFAAAGPFLRVFRNESSELLGFRRIFDTQSIHGIALRESLDHKCFLLIWGGRHVRVGCLKAANHSKPEFAFGPTVRVQDWILDLAIKPNYIPQPELGRNELRAAAVTAHNVLVDIRYGRRQNQSDECDEDER